MNSELTLEALDEVIGGVCDNSVTAAVLNGMKESFDKAGLYWGDDGSTATFNAGGNVVTVAHNVC